MAAMEAGRGLLLHPLSVSNRSRLDSGMHDARNG